MRVNDKVLIENINDYFTHKGLSPNLIDDIKGKLKKELKKSEAQDLDYIEYRKKSPAEIILTIQRNLFTLQLNPIVFFIINFILLSYLYDIQYVPFHAATVLSIFYCLIILLFSIFIFFSFDCKYYLYIINFILLSFLYDKQYVPFQAATGLSIFYCLIILPISNFIYLRIDWKNYLYSNTFERVIGLSVAAAALILVFAHAFGFNLGIVAVSLYAIQFICFVGIIFIISGFYFEILEVTGIVLLFYR